MNVAARRHLGGDRSSSPPAGLQAVEGLLQRVRGDGAGAATVHTRRRRPTSIRWRRMRTSPSRRLLARQTEQEG